MRTAHTARSRSVLALMSSLLVIAVAACGSPDLPSDGPTASPAVLPSATPLATPAEPTLVMVDAPVGLAELMATIESAYEIGHPDVDVAVALHDAAAFQERLFDEQPADVFLVDSVAGTDRSMTAVSTQPALRFSTEYVALLADRSGVAGPVLSFLSWLMGPNGRAIVGSAGLTPPP